MQLLWPGAKHLIMKIICNNSPITAPFISIFTYLFKYSWSKLCITLICKAQQRSVNVLLNRSFLQVSVFNIVMRGVFSFTSLLEKHPESRALICPGRTLNVTHNCLPSHNTSWDHRTGTQGFPLEAATRTEETWDQTAWGKTFSSTMKSSAGSQPVSGLGAHDAELKSFILFHI